MIPKKFTDLGFEITRFGASSQVLRFKSKPIFVFNSLTDVDTDFLTHICETYLRICAKRSSLSCLPVTNDP